MKNIKQKAAAAVLALVGIVGAASLLIGHKSDYARVPSGYVYESNYKEAPDGRENEKVLLVSEAKETGDIQRESADTGEGYLFSGQGEASWDFDIEEAGDYYISAVYMPLSGNGQSIQFQMEVDGRSLSEQGETLSLSRLWTDSGDFKRTAGGDEMRPAQTEISIWTDENFMNSKSGEVKIHLEKGSHSISIANTRENCLLKGISLYTQNTPSYQEYLAKIKGQDADSGYFQFLEAETPYLKSSSELYPVYDKSSPYTSPYNAVAIRYNAIGGSGWTDEGQWIEWKIQVPEDGNYQLGMRFLQNINKGVVSCRKITIDGSSPFKEMEEVKFPYDISWQTMYLGGDTPYSFYLTKGEHTLRAEVSLGDLSGMISRMEDTVYSLNALYREIIMITGTQPDIYRDYDLPKAIPDLKDKIEKIEKELDGYETYLKGEYGEGNYASRIISQLKRQLLSFEEKPYTIQKRLSVFKTNISSMAEWVLSFKEQPLELDCLYVAGIGAKLPKAETNWLGKAGHEIRAFVGSFAHNYNSVASSEENESTATLNVWLGINAVTGKGRDQANVIKRLIDDDFTKETGIQVNLSLVDGALVKAAIAGKGPDVNLFTSRGEAMNLAFRGALLSMEELNGFEDIKKDYMDSAFVPYEYEKEVYGIPEEQVFYTMFIRKDIFEELNIPVPGTWEELMGIMPVLQGENLSIGLPYTDGYATMGNGLGTINLLPTLLMQRGISIFNNDHTKTQLDSSTAYGAFKMWSDFYRMYDFPLYKDDFNRFRTGEMPIIIAPYTLYNTLYEAAPEIAGQWDMTVIPGTKDEDGNLNVSTGASGSCSTILKDSKAKEAAWEFVKWWNSAKIQEEYSKGIEGELGVLGRYTPANQQAFEKTNWYEEEKSVLREQWAAVVEIPEVPGGYYVSRNIDNAFRGVYYNGENARESLYTWAASINEELARKQAQIKLREENKK